MLLTSAGKPIYESFKPKTTTKVANRLIGAALGIRMPAKKVEDPPLEKKQSVIVDAWDD